MNDDNDSLLSDSEQVKQRQQQIPTRQSTMNSSISRLDWNDRPPSSLITHSDVVKSQYGTVDYELECAYNGFDSQSRRLSMSTNKHHAKSPSMRLNDVMVDINSVIGHGDDKSSNDGSLFEDERGGNGDEKKTRTNHKNVKRSSSSLFSDLRYWLLYEDGLPLCIFIAIQMLFFLLFFCLSRFSPQFSSARGIMGYGLMFARGCAGALNLTSCIMVLTMCRQTLTFLAKNRFLRKILWLDHIQTVHRWAGISLVVFAVGHIVAHVFNFLSVSTLLSLSDTPNSSFNQMFFLSPTGMTGTLLFVVLLIIGVGSALRRKLKYEVFYYTHYFLFAYYALMLLHGTFCFIKLDVNDGQNKCNQPYFYKLFMFPGVLYFIERVFCFEIIGRTRTVIRKVKIHPPGDILEIQFEKSLLKSNGVWTYKPGHYVYLNVPALSLFQWHPFTLTSCPDDSYMSVHIHTTGDWSKGILDLMKSSYDKSKAAERNRRFNGIASPTSLPRLHVAGPYCAPADQVFQYEAVVLVGAGIGITPYMSILRAFRYRSQHPAGLKRTKRIYLIWICRDVQTFKCMKYFLEHLEREFKTGENVADVHVSLYWTAKSVMPETCYNIYLHSNDDIDPLTGLKTKTVVGRPKWRQLFTEIHSQNENKKLGVFVCGPTALTRTITKTCTKIDDSKEWFDVHDEVF